MSGGYRISNRIKTALVDIHRQARNGLDIVETSTNLESEDRRRFVAAYKKIIDLVQGVFE